MAYDRLVTLAYRVPLFCVVAPVVAASIAACGSSSSNADASHRDGGSTAHDDGGTRVDGGKHVDAGAHPDGGRDASSPDGSTTPRDGGVDAFAGRCEAEAVATCSCASGMGTRRCFADGTAWGGCSCSAYGADLYVSPAGLDTNPGTLAAPFLTLERAQTAVRAMKTAGLPAGGVVVWLRGGVYPRQATFALTNSDSGTAASPVVYRGYPAETARVSGGTQLPASAFKVVTSSSPVWSRLDPTAQGVVVAADLSSLGITDYGTLAPRGFGAQGVTAALELFIDGTRQPLGRWPDADSTDPDVTYGFSSVATVTSNTVIALSEDRATRWSHAPDPWVHGYFAYTWADDNLAVSRVDASTGTLTLASAPSYGITNPLQGAGAPPIMAFNLLEEITEPGEWYVDRTSGLLYLWPPANLAQHDVVASILAAPLVTVTGASNIVLQELTFEASRTKLLTIQGSSTDVDVVGCTLRDSGDSAAEIADGSGNVFDGVLIHDTGEGGVSVGGGDRPTLTQAGNVVKNSDIHDFSQFVWTYTPAVNVSGDGNIVKNNVLHGAPHAAILYSGSQHTFSENEIYGVCGFTSDAGAIYSGRDWGARGNVIKWNFIHDVASNMKGGYGVHAIYLDDCLSGITVTGNVVWNVTGFGIEHGGGRDNLMTNNIFANAGTAVLEADNRCASSPSPVTNVPGDSWNLLQKLEAVNYQMDPWATTYPSCAAIPDDFATVTASGSPWLEPQGCTFVNNLGFQYAAWTNASAAALAAYASMSGNLQNVDPLFAGEAALNVKSAVSKTPLALQPGSPVVALQGASPTPFASIGIQP
jgi:hypothetical protein